MTHPCLVTLNHDSAPRVLSCGDQLVEVPLPAGTKVLYPKAPLPAIKDVPGSVRHALAKPVDCDALHARLRPGIKVTVALDAGSAQVAYVGKGEALQVVVEQVLGLLAQHGVEDVVVLVTCGLNRRLSPPEVRRLVGKRVYKARWPKTLYNCTAEDEGELCELGTTDAGEVVSLNRRAATSDLLIHCGMRLTPSAGGFEAIIFGLCGAQTQLACLAPTGDSDSNQRAVERVGGVLTQKLDVFSIELTFNNRRFGESLSFLSKNEDDLSGSEQFSLKALVGTSRQLAPWAGRKLLREGLRHCELTGVYAGSVARVREAALGQIYRQQRIPIERQADVVVVGLSSLSPYSAGVAGGLNPLLVQHMTQAQIFNQHAGVPFLKKGGTMIICNPCTDKFEHSQHASYRDFVHRLLPLTRDCLVLSAKFQEAYASNPAFVEMFRKGRSYHPLHPFLLWNLAENGRRHIGKVIVVGADNEYIPERLGYQTAATIQDALYWAKNGRGAQQEVLCLHSPLGTIADVMREGACT